MRRCAPVGRWPVPNGSETTNSLPLPIVLSTRIDPSCNLVSSCTNANPIPEPS